MDVFSAVSDPTRRRILDILAVSERAVMEIVSSFKISQPSISEHLRILRSTGLVSVRPTGRQRIYSLNPIRLRELADWIARYEHFWGERLQNLESYMHRRFGPGGPPTLNSEAAVQPAGETTQKPDANFSMEID